MIEGTGTVKLSNPKSLKVVVLRIKGSKNVKIVNAGTSHATFTFTMIISAAGEVVGSHCLFSNLKKKPKDINYVHIDVNKTGMWREELVCSFFEKHIPSRYKTSLLREPILVILESFSAHLKIGKKYEKFNVYLSFVLQV